jgi:Tfp pilus assembly protein PilF
MSAPRLPATALLVAIALALYANALPNDFAFDDYSTLLRNTSIRSLATLPELFSPRQLYAAYRPVRYLSFALDHAVSGDRPWAYHLFNSLYHGLAAAVVFLVLRRLTRDGRAALAGALLFVVHPVHTECVAYISGRRDLLVTLFYLLAFLAWLRWRETGRALDLALGAAAFGLALGSKETAVTLPAALALHDLVLARSPARLRVPALALAAAAVALLAWRAITAGVQPVDPPWWGGSAEANYATAARIVARYAQLLVAPTTLLADYSAEAFPLSRSFAEPGAALAALALCGAAGMALACRTRAPLAAFGVGWFFLTLAPVAQVWPYHELAAEHHLYLPSVGACLLAGLGVEAARRRAGARIAYGLFAVVLVAFAARTAVRNLDWRDAETISRATIEAAPRCARARLNLGVCLARRGDGDAALAEVEEALRIRPDYVAARFRRAELLERAGRRAEARADYEAVLAAIESGASSPIPAGEVCLRLGRYVDGIAFFEADLAANPLVPGPLLGLANCHDLLGNRRPALRYFERYLAARPDNAAAAARAAVLAEELGDRDRAAALRARTSCNLGDQRRAE